jgi:hypothetical protein
MAYRKLLTQKTYDELKGLNDECKKLNCDLSDENRVFNFKPSIILGGDEKIRYKIEIEVNGVPNYHSLYGETIYEINNALVSFKKGLTV